MRPTDWGWEMSGGHLLPVLTDWGREMSGGHLLPVLTDQQAAPDGLLRLIHC